MLKLTKINGTNDAYMKVGEHIIGTVQGTAFPKYPTVGRPFALTDITYPENLTFYRTSLVKKVNGNTFETENSVYRLEAV